MLTTNDIICVFSISPREDNAICAKLQIYLLFSAISAIFAAPINSHTHDNGRI